MSKNFELYLTEEVLVSISHLPMLMQTISTDTKQKNEIIVSKDQVDHHVFFVEKGLIRLFDIDEEGNEHTILIIPENQMLFNVESCYFGRPSKYFVEAIEETELILLGPKFKELANRLGNEFRNYNEFLLYTNLEKIHERINVLISLNKSDKESYFSQKYKEIIDRIPDKVKDSFMGFKSHNHQVI
ncbi:cyclic nucleotide-binding domain-containing protein [Belliella sp. DSM 111904]|uniref:Cyclic nucleotide-binding domain-containing protein n=1 Tax=Belliella filtrata TaxID=2923435 RepID=A0ABS9V081_9BACT|nr:cyclic nucleotide-binding domain-containing protein [Belliella filtrata]MCH7409814.1 cyclic nucleotide-binding domain-containing protein [Belliella filtrata]